MPILSDAKFGGNLLATCDSVKSRNVPPEKRTRYFLYQILLGLHDNKNRRVGFSYNTFIDNTWLLEIAPELKAIMEAVDARLYVYGVSENRSPSLEDILRDRSDDFTFSSDPYLRTKSQLSRHELDQKLRRASDIENSYNGFLLYARPPENVNRIYVAAVKNHLSDFRRLSELNDDNETLRALDRVQNTLEGETTRSAGERRVAEANLSADIREKILESVLNVAYYEQFRRPDDEVLHGAYAIDATVKPVTNAVYDEIRALLLKHQLMGTSFDVKVGRITALFPVIKWAANSLGSELGVDGVIDFADKTKDIVKILTSADSRRVADIKFRAVASIGRNQVFRKISDSLIKAAKAPQAKDQDGDGGNLQK